MHQDFLFELGCEELPAGELLSMAQYLNNFVGKKLAEARLNFTEIQPFYTPRRLALLISKLQTETQSQIIERRGPAKNAPASAIAGFLKSCNATHQDLIEIETDKGTWLTVKINQPAVSAKVILKEAVEQAIKTMPLKKTMRWGANEFAFIRPVHWIVALLGEDTVPIELFGLSAGRTTYGHRFHHPEPILLQNPSEYMRKLDDAKVMVDFEVRLKRIKELAGDCVPEGLYIRTNEHVIHEVANLVEWPVPLLCKFEKEFLAVPQAVLISTMEANQRVLPIVNKNEILQNCFVIVANIQSKDPQEVIHGNEKVVRARLSDAKFFYDEDLKIPLEKHLEGLKKITFQQGLGSLFDKSKRLEGLVESADAKRAAQLCKADLVTQMVQEFPELQGYMGCQYALAQGERPEVALAIEDHYKPKGRGGELPRNEIGAELALADKIDTLVGLFSIGKEPTSSGDPFALRRQALGVIAILVQRQMSVNLLTVFSKLTDKQDVIAKLTDFFKERIINWFRDEHSDIDIQNVYFVLGKPGLVLDPYVIFSEIMAFAAFQKIEAGERLCQMVKRLSGIIDEKMVFGVQEQSSNQFEQQLLDAYFKADREQWWSLSVADRYQQFLDYAKPLEAFFDNVMVNDSDPAIKKRRQELVAQVYCQFKKLGDFSKL